MASDDIPKLNIFSRTMSAKYKNLILFLSIITLIGLGIAAFSVYKYTRMQKELQAIKKSTTASQKTNNDQMSKIVAEVGKIYKLPEGEVPTMATISDVNKLKDQPFFKNSKNGDILLVYNKAGKAILYNPTEKKIVEVAPVGDTSQQIRSKVWLRNGTSTGGLASKLETEIQKNFPGMTIAGKDNAVKNNYDKTIVIVLNDSAKDAGAVLAKTLNVSTADLPSGENKPAGADLLVIIGKDRT